MYVQVPITGIEFMNLHKKYGQIVRQQIYGKALLTSIQPGPDHNREWLGCIGTKKGDKFGITSFSPNPLWMGHVLWLSMIPSYQWSYNRFDLGTYDEYSIHWQQNALV